MPLRRGTPFTFKPTGLSDAVDGTNVPAGAMASLANLIPDPSTRNVFVARPASVKASDFVAGGFTAPGFVSGELVVGDLVYGMVATGRNAAKDEPYCFNMATRTFNTIAGITNANTPASPPTSGDWTPPILAQVGSRVIVTHPGFPGGVTKFGWFDVSGFSEMTNGTLTIGSAVVTGNPSVIGVQPGMTISDGAINIPAGTTVLSTTQFILDQQGITHGTTTIDGLATTAGVAAGQGVFGLGVPIGATVATVGTGSVTISAPASGSAVTAITFVGATITMSVPATGSHSGSALTIAGGTVAAPLWGAGDCDLNPLPSVPVGVAQMNGRAYYACGTNGIPFSDSGFACRISNTTVVQALTTNDGLAITAIAPLQLSSLLGGIVQSLIAFEGVSKIQQISGDLATSNLAMNALPIDTGTLSPLSLCATEKGLAFVSPEGLRIVDFSGNVSTPIGDAGDGVAVPFIDVLYPSRTCAAARADTLRISVQSALAPGPQEFWFDLSRKVWTGPHSFPASLIQPWRDSFVSDNSIGIPGKPLWQSDAASRLGSVDVANGNLLSWTFQPSPLPDTGQMAENALIEMTVAVALAPGTVMTVTAQDISGTFLDTTTVSGRRDADGLGRLQLGAGGMGRVGSGLPTEIGQLACAARLQAAQPAIQRGVELQREDRERLHEVPDPRLQAGGSRVIRRLLLALGLVVAATTADAACTVPVTLANGTLADAGQVMQNFNAIITCINNSLGSGVIGPTTSTVNHVALFNNTTGNLLGMAALQLGANVTNSAYAGGADPTGVGDSTQAIRAAINATHNLYLSHAEHDHLLPRRHIQLHRHNRCEWDHHKLPGQQQYAPDVRRRLTHKGRLHGRQRDLQYVGAAITTESKVATAVYGHFIHLTDSNWVQIDHNNFQDPTPSACLTNSLCVCMERHHISTAQYRRRLKSPFTTTTTLTKLMTSCSATRRTRRFQCSTCIYLTIWGFQTAVLITRCKATGSSICTTTRCAAGRPTTFT